MSTTTNPFAGRELLADADTVAAGAAATGAADAAATDSAQLDATNPFAARDLLPPESCSDRTPSTFKNPLAGRDLLRLLDLSPEEFELVLSTAQQLKQQWKADAATAQRQAPFVGQAVAVILEKPSVRTRVSFELAIARLGGHPVLMSDAHSAFSRGETIKDTMMVMERFVRAIVIRSFAQSRIEEMAHWASVPIVNALTDDFHPCQGLADFMTIRERKGDFTKLKLAYVGDGNNMAHTYLEAGALSGMEVHVATPAGYAPQQQYVQECQQLAAKTGAKLVVGTDMAAALQGADVVITDTWASMGAEDEHAERVRAFAPYQVNSAAFEVAAPGAIFLHCLPAHRGEEVTDEVMDADYSAIYDEAENRLHAQQALLQLLLMT